MRHFAILICVFILGVASLFAQTPEALTLRIESINSNAFPQVDIEVTVLDQNGRAVPRLTAENFMIFEDTSAATITNVRPSNRGVSVVLVVDTSESMFALPAAQEAAAAFVNALGIEDRVALIDFDSNVVTHHPLTDNHGQVLRVIDEALEIGGRTALYDGALAGVREAERSGEGRRVVVLLADGNESGESIATRNAPLDAALEAGIPIYTIGLGAQADRTYLENIAALTGGQYLDAPSANALTDLYVGLAEQLRQAYILTIDSNVPGDGGSHLLNVEVTLGNMSDIANASFIAAEIPPEIVLNTATNDEGATITPEIVVQGGSYEVTWDVAGAVDASSVPPYALSLNFADHSPGTLAIAANVTDAAGQTAQAQTMLDIPAIPPSFTVDGLRENQELDAEAINITLNIASQTEITEAIFALDDETIESLDTLPFETTIDPLALEAGQHTLSISVENEGGISEQSLTFTTTLSPPQISLSDLPETISAEPFTLSATLDDEEAQLTWLLDGETLRPNADGAIEINPMDYPPEELQLQVTATDVEGLSSTETLTLTIPELAPILSLNGLSEAPLTKDETTFTLTIESQREVEAVRFALNDGDFETVATAPYRYDIDVLALAAEGSAANTLMVEVDFGEDTQPYSESFDFAVGIAPPQISLSGLPEVAFTDSTTLEVTVDTAAEIEWMVDNEILETANLDADESTTFELDPMQYEAGEHTLQVRAQDDRGLVSESDAVLLSVPALPPRLEVIGLQADETLSGSVEVSLEVASQSPLENVTYQIDDQSSASVTQAPYLYTLVPDDLGEGDHTLRVSALNATGQEATQQIAFSVDPAAITSDDGLPLIPIGAGVIVGLVVLVAGLSLAGRRGEQSGFPGKIKLIYEDIVTGNEVTYKIASERTIIGRASGADISLIDPNQRISREHAAIEKRGATWVVVDLESRHGVLVNGQKIEGSRVIGDGDVIRISEIDLTFVAPGVEVHKEDLMETRFEALPDTKDVQPKRQTLIKDDDETQQSSPTTHKRQTLIKDDDSHSTDAISHGGDDFETSDDLDGATLHPDDDSHSTEDWGGATLRPNDEDNHS